MLYKGDNLELLKLLPEQHIDLIYCDILYGTGRNFEDYQDLKANRGIIEDFYTPRIIEMHRVLKETGSIYLQMDWRISHWVRLIMDNVFGYDNLRNEIIWSYKSGGNSKRTFAKKHDTILFYSINNTYTFNIQRYKSWQLKKYNYNPKYPEYYDEKEKKWYHLAVCRDVWDDIYVIGTDNNERMNYDTQKPKALLERIIRASSNEGDVVADFFMGSGTTGEVALELGRKFVGCDIGDKACQITKERINKLQ